MRRVDYNTVQYQDYARGRALLPAQRAAWLDAFADRLPARRPLDGIDLGCGTGRFTPALADAFGPVTGVEPADRMREIAIADAAHPAVRYVRGSAEAIPLADASVDYTLVFLAWHHVQDKRQAAREIARVTRAGGTLLLRAQFSDHMPRLWWLEYFPGGHELDASIFESLADVRTALESAGWLATDFGQVYEPPARSRAEVLARLRLRTMTIFEYFTPEQMAVGFERLERAVAADPDAAVPPVASTLLTLVRP